MLSSENDKRRDKRLALTLPVKFFRGAEEGLSVLNGVTHNVSSGGVYFEAGFALGLGLPVIWTVKETGLEHLHFDTRQYNHIGWKDPEDLREMLQLRLQATVAPPTRRPKWIIRR